MFVPVLINCAKNVPHNYETPCSSNSSLNYIPFILRPPDFSLKPLPLCVIARLKLAC